MYEQGIYKRYVAASSLLPLLSSDDNTKLALRDFPVDWQGNRRADRPVKPWDLGGLLAPTPCIHTYLYWKGVMDAG